MGIPCVEHKARDTLCTAVMVHMPVAEATGIQLESCVAWLFRVVTAVLGASFCTVGSGDRNEETAGIKAGEAVLGSGEDRQRTRHELGRAPAHQSPPSHQNQSEAG